MIFPFLIGRDVNREIDQEPTRWIIDFGLMTKEAAEAYPGAMRHVRKHVYPLRKKNRRLSYATYWWRFVEPRGGLRSALRSLEQAIVVPCVSPRMIAVRKKTQICFDHQLMVIALSDAYHLGILQSRFHGLWARARGSTLKGDLRYTNTTIFETFPFPVQPDGSYRPRVRPRTDEAKDVERAAEAFEKERARACLEHRLGLTKIHNRLDAGALPELAAAYSELNDAVAACYGFAQGAWADDQRALRLLLDLNHQLAREESRA